jgi:hypothetical protein
MSLTPTQYDGLCRGLDWAAGLLTRSRNDTLDLIDLRLGPALSAAADVLGLEPGWSIADLDQAVAELRSGALDALAPAGLEAGDA